MPFNSNSKSKARESFPHFNRDNLKLWQIVSGQLRTFMAREWETNLLKCGPKKEGKISQKRGIAMTSVIDLKAPTNRSKIEKHNKSRCGWADARGIQKFCECILR